MNLSMELLFAYLASWTGSAQGETNARASIKDWEHVTNNAGLWVFMSARGKACGISPFGNSKPSNQVTYLTELYPLTFLPGSNLTFIFMLQVLTVPRVLSL